ncbi:hypothetical protein H6P81_016467 [Aristolochia fimbriata]|uniref:Uncharacterized protein n=1 Tax=Aristolochia fimbriata TaxID=158543 RepID=A0AAV7EBL1_ARIFI|nr:hypothetical protein H6P81_016467 [Aristolochia fimbriata]
MIPSQWSGVPFQVRGTQPSSWPIAPGTTERNHNRRAASSENNNAKILGLKGSTRFSSLSKPLAFCTTEVLQKALTQQSKEATTSTPTSPYKDVVQAPLLWEYKSTKDLVCLIPEGLNIRQQPGLIAHQALDGSHLFSQRVGKTIEYYRNILLVSGVIVHQQRQSPTEITRTQGCWGQRSWSVGKTQLVQSLKQQWQGKIKHNSKHQMDKLFLVRGRLEKNLLCWLFLQPELTSTMFFIYGVKFIVCKIIHGWNVQVFLKALVEQSFLYSL